MPGIEVKIAPVGRNARLLNVGEVEQQIAERLIGFLLKGNTHELLAGQIFGLFLPACLQEFANLA